MVAEPVDARSVWSIQNAQKRFDEVIRLVEQGKTVAIVRDGSIVAEMKAVAKPEFASEERQAETARLLEERAEWEPLQATLDQLIAWRHEGHRW
jgi:antitoxin (DNA-binding transcriptional repressor) of toxin-antitoxin stability system